MFGYREKIAVLNLCLPEKKEEELLPIMNKILTIISIQDEELRHLEVDRNHEIFNQIDELFNEYINNVEITNSNKNDGKFIINIYSNQSLNNNNRFLFPSGVNIELKLQTELNKTMIDLLFNSWFHIEGTMDINSKLALLLMNSVNEEEKKNKSFIPEWIKNELFFSNMLTTKINNINSNNDNNADNNNNNNNSDNDNDNNKYINIFISHISLQIAYNVDNTIFKIQKNITQEKY